MSASPIVVLAPKSMGVSLILTFLFGPLGMLYSTIIGGMIMMIASAVALVLTAGIGLLVTWPMSIIWAAIATSSYNKSLLARR